MDLRIYQKAKRYAARIKYNNPIDLVHDLYLKWYDKTGQDLFDEPEGRVMSMIWKECSNSIRKGQWMFMGKRYAKVEVTFSEGHYIDDVIPPHKWSPITPLDYVIGKELYQRFADVVDKADNDTKKILEYKRQGYNEKEIAKELNMSQYKVRNKLKQVNLDGIRSI